MQALFFANWKMHGDTAFVNEWTAKFVPPPNCQIVVCPPLPYLATVRAALPTMVAIGAQNVARWIDNGTYTGEVSARMAADSGCRYALIGHSERRVLLHETDKDCAAKIAATVTAGMCPVLCVGESIEERAAGKTDDVIHRQLQALSASGVKLTEAVIAYEPVWAIGSGNTPTVDEIARVRRHLRQWLITENPTIGDKIPLLYGGSVSLSNVDMLGQSDMNGGLVGGASLQPTLFSDICAHSGINR
ncbi:triose-phosphate isomerase [Candidatus Persebacteraceae bacterium Df01]|jgi:triosephosphate isomerase|uniref:Triosephosphate isomerase n=1 Tax=Candidatus Doriopsillibacter californiensis TaxID=2970740 RepID=A0ABT7QKY9_9GAMM|nr:triose-phosphate isomerase [Candidatus Persebacteraceae bacterium Df01]